MPIVSSSPRDRWGPWLLPAWDSFCALQASLGHLAHSESGTIPAYPDPCSILLILPQL